MLISLKNKNLSAKRGISSIVGTLLMVAVVASVGSVILFQGMNNINNFNYMLSFLTGSKGSISEDITIEHVRFDPTSNSLNIYLRNTGIQEVEIDKITVVKMDTQDLIWTNQTNTKIFISEFKNMTQTPNITAYPPLPPLCTSACWNVNQYNSTDYQISITTTLGNSFETIARPFNS